MLLAVCVAGVTVTVPYLCWGTQAVAISGFEY